MSGQKQMRRALCGAAALAVVVVAQPAQAQQRGEQGQRARPERFQHTPEQRVERRVAMLTQQLVLSSEQAARVRTILLREAEQTKAVFDRAGITPPDRRGPRGPRPDSAGARPEPTEAERAQMEQRRRQMEQIRPELARIHTQTESELGQMLNQQQRQKYEELRASMRPGRRGRGGLIGPKVPDS